MKLKPGEVRSQSFQCSACGLEKKNQDLFTIEKNANAYWDDLSTDSICRNQTDPERLPDCCSERTESHARLVSAKSA